MIEARGLRRQFGSVMAVDDVSLSVPDGTILAVLGPNGAGKTTTVRLLAGLLTPTAGEAVVAGCNVRTDPAGVRSRVGLVTDSPGLHDQMTPVAYLDFFGRVYGLDRDARGRRIVASDSAAALRAGASHETLVQVLLAAPCEAAVTIVERVAGVSDPVLSRTPQGLLLAYRTAQSQRTNPQVIGALVAAGAGIVSVTCTAATLEDVYATAVGNTPSSMAGAHQ